MSVCLFFPQFGSSAGYNATKLQNTLIRNMITVPETLSLVSLILHTATVPETLSLGSGCSARRAVMAAVALLCHCSGLLQASSFSLCIWLRSAVQEVRIYCVIILQRASGKTIKHNNCLLYKRLQETVGCTNKIAGAVSERGSSSTSTPGLVILHVSLQLGLITLPLFPLQTPPLLLLLNLQCSISLFMSESSNNNNT